MDLRWEPGAFQDVVCILRDVGRAVPVAIGFVERGSGGKYKALSIDARYETVRQEKFPTEAEARAWLEREAQWCGIEALA